MFGALDNIGHVKMQKSAMALDDATINHHGVDIFWCCRLNHGCFDLRKRRDIQVGRTDENKVGALSGCQRSSDITQPRARAPLMVAISITSPILSGTFPRSHSPSTECPCST